MDQYEKMKYISAAIREVLKEPTPAAMKMLKEAKNLADKMCNTIETPDWIREWRTDDNTEEV